MEEILISAQISLIGLSNPLFTTDGQNEERFALRVKKKSEVPPDQLPVAGQTMTGTMRGQSYQEPVLGESMHIQNQAHLTKIVKDYQGVIVCFYQE